MMKPKFIDSEKEYIKVLYELNQLDDMDDWELYKQQEKRMEADLSNELWSKYLTPNKYK